MSTDQGYRRRLLHSPAPVTTFAHADAIADAVPAGSGIVGV
ncbi:hypothetical protein [Microbacterium sp.]|nr:hypothetical protein [Microbacterium sp.]HWL79119.1 hypothetical protein [Microbacterium sp.]